MKKIAIIGAGPSGAYAAYLLAKKGHTVTIYEEHEQIGEPIQCTGILTDSIFEITKLPKNIIAKKISKLRFHSNDELAELEIDKPELIVHREKFDRHFIDMAATKGVIIKRRHKLSNIIPGKKIQLIFHKRKQTETCDFLIGADGPLSIVSKLINEIPPERYFGIQALVKTPEADDSCYETFFSKDYDNSFAWVVPEGNSLFRIGVATRNNTREIFNEFLRKLEFDHYTIYSNQAGHIPIYNPELCVLKENIALVGDAATHVKATTFGGIIPGLRGAKEIAGYVDYAISNINVQVKNSGLKIHNELKTHLLLRKIMNQFSQEDFDWMVRILNHPDIRNILKNTSRDDMDHSLIYKNLLTFLKIGINPKNWKQIARMKWFYFKSL